MTAEPGGPQPMTEAERSLVLILRDRVASFSSRSHSAVAEMLRTGDRYVEEHPDSDRKYCFVSAHAIQDLGAEHCHQIEVSVSVQSDVAHVGTYLYFDPQAGPTVDSKVYRRPVNDYVTYNVCEII